MNGIMREPLGGVCAPRPGTRDPRREPETHFRYVDIGSVDNASKVIVEAKSVLGKDAPSRARKIIREGDVLVSMTRPNLNAVAMVPRELDGEICSTGFGVLRASERLLPEYLFHFVKSAEFVSAASGAVSGAMYPAITERFLRSIPIPLPPIEEQRRIVDILNRAASIERLRATASAHLRDFVPALFIKMFGDPIENPMGWEVSALEDHITHLTSGSRGWKKYYSESGARFIRVQNVKAGHLKLDDIAHVAPPDNAETRRTLVQKGDVVITITGSPGISAPIPDLQEKYYVNQHVALMRLSDTLLPEYLAAFVNSDSGGQLQFRQTAYGQTRSGLGLSEIRKLQVPLPPLELQRAFAQLVEATRARSAIADEASALAADLSQSLLGKLLGTEGKPHANAHTDYETV